MSGLLSVALETCILPTRIRDSDSSGRLGSLGDMAALLNVSGSQKIANLTMSIHNMEEKKSDGTPLPPASSSLRDSASKIELSWDSSNTRIRGKKIDDGHVFAEAEVMRGFNEKQVMEETAAASRTVGLAHDRRDAILGR